MNIVRSAPILLIGLLPLAFGCARPDVEPGRERVSGAASAIGNGTTNGFDGDIAAECTPAILAAMGMPLVTAGALNGALDETLQPGDKCEEALRYAYKCAGALDDVLPGPNGGASPYAGGELMTTGTGWRTSTSGLGAALNKESILTCMTTLMNSFSGVAICLEGAEVAEGEEIGDCSAYGVDEAVWLTKLDAAGGVVHHVWPLDPASLCAPGLLEASLAMRVCANVDPASCNLVIHGESGDLDADCEVVGGYYECFGQPAIKTMLTTAGREAMYSCEQ